MKKLYTFAVGFYVVRKKTITNQMLSKSQIKFISSLKHKKYREQYNMFVAEGEKLITDLGCVFKCRYLVAIEEHIENIAITADERIAVGNADDLKKISSLTTPNKALAVFYKPSAKDILPDAITDKLVLALDGIQDTGNLGTIVRIADWYGIEHIVCSPNTVDIFNPKTVQATMGAIANVNVTYCNLPEFLTEIKQNGIPVYGTFLDGKDIYDEKLNPHGVVVFGNEGNGISCEVSNMVDKRITIPNFSHKAQTSESLNVAVATAIVCSEFKRGSR